MEATAAIALMEMSTSMDDQHHQRHHHQENASNAVHDVRHHEHMIDTVVPTELGPFIEWIRRHEKQIRARGPTHLDVGALLDALDELNDLVGMAEPKRVAVRQIKYFLRNGGKFDGHYRHTAIEGDPGTGKTTLGKTLVRIWTAMGLFQQSSSSNNSEVPSTAAQPTDILQQQHQRPGNNNNSGMFTLSSSPAFANQSTGPTAPMSQHHRPSTTAGPLLIPVNSTVQSIRAENAEKARYDAASRLDNAMRTSSSLIAHMLGLRDRMDRADSAAARTQALPPSPSSSSPRNSRRSHSNRSRRKRPFDDISSSNISGGGPDSPSSNNKRRCFAPTASAATAAPQSSSIYRPLPFEYPRDSTSSSDIVETTTATLKTPSPQKQHYGTASTTTTTIATPSPSTPVSATTITHGTNPPTHHQQQHVIRRDLEFMIENAKTVVNDIRMVHTIIQAGSLTAAPATSSSQPTGQNHRLHGNNINHPTGNNFMPPRPAEAEAVSTPPSMTAPAAATTTTPWTVLSRPDFVSDYMGQTARQTRRALETHRGKGIFIDEAHSLYQDEKDTFGKEAAGEILRFMDAAIEDTVVILATYPGALKDSIFKADRGLRRRIQWFFKIEGYSAAELAEIFCRQARRYGDWQVSADLRKSLVPFFQEHMRHFPHYAGDTFRLLYHCKLASSERHALHTLIGGSSKGHHHAHVDDGRVLSAGDLKAAFDEYCMIQNADGDMDRHERPFYIS